MDHDSKKTIRVEISAITIKLVTETEHTLPPASPETGSMLEKTKTQKTYAIEPLTIESEEVRSIHGDPLPSDYSDPSVDEFLAMLDNPAAQKAIGTMVEAFMKGGAIIPPGADPKPN